MNHPHPSDDHFVRAHMICEAFEQTQRVMWSYMWPMGHCAVSSLLLAPMLRAGLERDYHVVIGWVRETRTHRPGAHAWVEDQDRNIYDPTYHQFFKKPDWQYKGEQPREPSALMVAAAGSPKMNLYHPLVGLTLDGEEEMRRSIKPQSCPDGWSASSNARQIFWFALDEMKRDIVDNMYVEV